MKLILSGLFCGQRGLWELDVLDVHFFDSLKDLPDEDGFFVLSYDLSSETLGLRLKSSSLPAIVFVKVGQVKRWMGTEGSYKLRFVGSSLSREEYMHRVLLIKKHIEDGTVYQLNLTNRFDFEFEGSTLSLFWDYYRRQPTPYSFFLDCEDFFVMSGSMELFLRKRFEKIVSRPIKGTSKDLRSLLESEKDKAENLMITDMMRNDLGRIAKPGSVKVKRLFRVQRYTTLFQMYSEVQAETKACFKDILMATFPPASVTGAPKVKAAEVIDTLEPHPRGYYCGCAGFKKGQDFTLCVLIRTAIGDKDRISYYAGAGIVADSDPQKEWQEVILKTKAFYSEQASTTRGYTLQPQF